MQSKLIPTVAELISRLNFIIDQPPKFRIVIVADDEPTRVALCNLFRHELGYDLGHLTSIDFSTLKVVGTKISII